MIPWIKTTLLAGAGLLLLASCQKKQEAPPEHPIQEQFSALPEDDAFTQKENLPEEINLPEDAISTEDLASTDTPPSVETQFTANPQEEEVKQQQEAPVEEPFPRELSSLIPYHRPAYRAVPHNYQDASERLATAGLPAPFAPLSYPIGGDKEDSVPQISADLAVLPEKKEEILKTPEEKTDPPEPEPAPEVVIIPEPEPEPVPEIVIIPEPEPEPVPEIVIIPEPEPEPAPEIVIIPEPEPEPTPEIAIVPEPEPVPESLVPEEEPESVPSPILPEEPEVDQNLLLPGPSIVLESPQADSYYQSSILLKGNVSPSQDAPEETSGVKSLTWRIEDLGEYDNTVFLEEDGSFTLDIFTTGLEGAQTLFLQSEDFGGRVSVSEISLKDGNQPPGLALEYPLPQGQYGSMLSVKGRLRDAYEGIPELEGITRLSYSLIAGDRSSGQSISTGDVELSDENSFFFAIDMAERSGEQTLRLEAAGANGAVATMDVALFRGGSDIPSFTILPQDERLVFTWDAISGAEEQTLYLTDDGTIPSEESGGSRFGSVLSPLTLGSVRNGIRYKARLKARVGDQTLWSDVMEAVPLSPGSLELTAEGRFEQIRLSWKDIPGASRYRIFRREENKESFIPLDEDISGTEYVDAAVQFGRNYYYRIEPSDVKGPLSYDVPASSLEAPSEKITMSSHYRDMTPLRVTVSGEYAFVAAGDTGFYIMDVSTPQKPLEIGHLDLGDVKDIFISGEYAYVASGSNGFSLVNISEPTKPFIVLSRVTEDASGIAGEENIVYLADGERGVQIFDISRRQDPRRLSSFHDFPAYQLVLKDHLLYVATGKDGMKVLDVTNPASPRLAGSYSQAPVYDLHLANESLYLACGEEGMIILENKDGQFNEVSRFRSSNARAVRIWEDYAMIADGSGGMKAVDISIPRDPHLFGSFDGQDTSSIAMAEDYALIADVSGLKVVRTYLHGQSLKLQSVPTPGRAYGVTLDGTDLWVVDRRGGVALYDFSSPSNLSENSLVRRYSSEYAEDILLMDETLYVADGPAGVKVFDINSPDKAVTSFPVSGRARRILPYGGSIAVVSSGDGVLFLKNNDMTGRINYPDVRDAAFYGTYLFAGDYKEGLIIMEMTGEGRAVELDILEEFQNIRQLMIKNDTLYVLHKEGISLMTITNPEHPLLKETISYPDAEAMQLSGNRLYVAGGFQGVSIYRIKEDLSALKVSDCEDIFAVDVAPAGSYAVYADMEGIGVIEVLIPEWVE